MTGHVVINGARKCPSASLAGPWKTSLRLPNASQKPVSAMILLDIEAMCERSLIGSGKIRFARRAADESRFHQCLRQRPTRRLRLLVVAPDRNPHDFGH